MEGVERDGVTGISGSEDAVKKLLLVGFQGVPLGARFFQMEDVAFGVSEAEEMILLCFFDDEVAADGEVDDGGSDVAHVDRVVDEGADFGRREIVRRLILRGDGAETRVAAVSPPPPEHREEGDDRDEERPVAAQQAKDAGKGRGFADGAFVESDGDGKAFVDRQRIAGLYIHAGTRDFHGGIARA